MRLLIVFAITVLCVTSAFAGRNDPEWNPPARFDHAYTGHLTVRYLPQKKVVTACAALFKEYGVDDKASFDMRGCSGWAGSSCTVIAVNKTFKGATPKAVLRHEVGHCNGWAADHSD